jgi:prepilin-type N-terminal cleavage/methylation domain-containing protein
MSRSQPARAAAGEGGFTLVEAVVGLSIVGILMAMAVPAWDNYRAAQERVSASRDVVSVLRHTQMRATAEETSYRVRIDAAARRLTVARYDGAVWVTRGSRALQGSAVRVTEPAFVDRSGTTTADAFFYARGTASPGSVRVSSSGSELSHVITVEGLTGRVSTS